MSLTAFTVLEYTRLVQCLRPVRGTRTRISSQCLNPIYQGGSIRTRLSQDKHTFVKITYLIKTQQQQSLYWIRRQQQQNKFLSPRSWIRQQQSEFLFLSPRSCIRSPGNLYLLICYRVTTYLFDPPVKDTQIVCVFLSRTGKRVLLQRDNKIKKYTYL